MIFTLHSIATNTLGASKLPYLLMLAEANWPSFGADYVDALVAGLVFKSPVIAIRAEDGEPTRQAAEERIEETSV